MQQSQHFTLNLPKQPFKHNRQQKIDIGVNNSQSRLHKFIVNADDFGISEPRCRGILQLIKAKKVGSISVLVTGVNGDSVVQWSKRLREYVFDAGSETDQAHNRLNHQNQHLLNKVSVGLHFNLTQGSPLCTSIPCPIVHPLTKSLMGKTFIYQYLSKQNHKHQPFPLNMQQFIKTELRLQIQRFIELFSFRPSHIDGHNHVHVIPQVAELIAPIMRESGIYRTRLPVEELQVPNEKNEIFAGNAKLAKPIFDRHKIVYPSIFVGCEEIGRLDWGILQKKISKRISQHRQGDNSFIELMCHPGYSDQSKGDEFNRSKGRQVELNSLKSQQFTSIIENHPSFKLSNFNYLSPLPSQSKSRILLYSKMSHGCGNWTTSLRLQQIFQSLGYEVYLRSIEQNINTQFEIESLRQFLIQFRITLVIGVNLTRSGRVVYHATRSRDQLTNRVPYFFIVAGTDANIYFNKPEAVDVLKEPLEHCQMILSLSDSMLKLTHAFLTEKLHFHQNQKPLILLSQSSNIRAFQKPLAQQRQSIHNCLKQNYNLDINKDRYIVFPASFRPVKDIQFLLSQFNQLIAKEQNLRVLVLGPVLDQAYYEKCLKKLGRVEYLGSLQKELYVEVLKNAFFLINSSISEGQCCSIQQALEVSQICVVRNNQGNAELIKHNETGFLFDTQEEFMAIYQQLSRNQKNLQQRIKKNALAYHKEHFSLQAQAKNYKQIFARILPEKGKLFTYPDVHGISEINLALYNQVPKEILQKWFIKTQTSPKRVIDMGCGSGIFGMTVLQRFSPQQQAKIRLEMYDYNASVISNCYYNCLQQLSERLSLVDSLRLQVSDMFQSVELANEGHLILANMPQTPFQKQSSRPDKNGGLNAMKFNQHLVRKFSSFSPNSMLVMLYSYMCQPKQFFQLIEQLKLKIAWRSQRTSFRIPAKAYDEMEEDLSQFLKHHIGQGKAEVEIVEENGEEIFVVPAEILVIQKHQQSA